MTREWERDMAAIQEDLSIIPSGVKLLALLVYGATLVGLPLLFRAFERNPPHLAVQVLLAAFIGIPLAVLTLAIGYVNRDAKRREMSAAFWTLLVALVPWAMGFVVYFVARRPVRRPCPGCKELVEEGVSFCPRCQHQLTPLCAGCRRPVLGGQQFCAHCGHALAVEGLA